MSEQPRDPAKATAPVDPRLDAAQREAVLHPGPTLRILAGPGSGKTRVLTSRVLRRVDDGSADPRHVLALTFTRRAAGEVRQRLRIAGIRDIANVGTFHAVALQQLRQNRVDNGRFAPEIVSSRAATLRSLAPREPNIGSVIAEIERSAARGINAAGLARRSASRGGGSNPAAHLYALYEKYKKRKGLLDFDDILRECTALMRDDPHFAAAQRWRFRHLFVDEYQDVNQTQFELLQTWLGGRDDLCVVGDPDQAIYGWNGADARYLTDFTRWFPAAVTVELTTNHRSTAPVVAAATAVLGERNIGERNVIVRKPTGPDPTVSSHETPAEEATDLSNRLRWKHGEGGTWSSYAILARTNAQLNVIADALTTAQIPYRIQGRGGGSNEPGAAATLKALVSSSDHFPTVLADLESDETLERGSESVLELGREFAGGSANATGEGFSQWMRTVRSNDISSSADGVDLVTFHAAKGLEWKHISIVGFEDGLVPMNNNDEERRLGYVALTRAEISVHLSWCKLRPRAGLMEQRSPSPWLADIAANIAPGVPAPADQVGGHMQTARSATSKPTATPSRGRIEAWRDTTARARRIEPQAIMADRHLDVLSLNRPQTLDDICALTGLSRLRVERDGQAILDALNC